MFEFTRPVITACGEPAPARSPALRSARRAGAGSGWHTSGSESPSPCWSRWPSSGCIWTTSFSVAKATRDLGYQPLFTTEQAMVECLPYYTELFDQMKAAASPAPVAIVAPAVAE